MTAIDDAIEERLELDEWLHSMKMRAEQDAERIIHFAYAERAHPLPCHVPNCEWHGHA